MITLDQYFGKHSHTLEHTENAKVLLNRVNLLLDDAKKYGVVLKIDKDTGCFIGGETLGGFRPEDCPQGAKNSPHKQGMGVDVYDPDNALDGWLDDIKLLKYDLYREHPEHTKSWCHLQSRKTKSGKRTFLP